MQAAYREVRKILFIHCHRYGGAYVDSTFQAEFLIDGVKIPFLHSVGGRSVRIRNDRHAIQRFFNVHVMEDIREGLIEFTEHKNDFELIEIVGLEVNVYSPNDINARLLYAEPRNFGEY